MRLQSLDGLRGIAAFMVVLSHISVLTHFPYAQNPGVPTWWETVLWNLGAPGVDVFFVLSGYVLALPHLHQGRPMHFVPFVLRRLRRLYPAYLAAVLLAVLLKHLHGPEKLTEIVTRWQQPLTLRELGENLFLLNPTMDMQSLNPVVWTLQVELHMALVFPLLLLLMGRTHVPSSTVLLLGFLVGFLGGFFVQSVGMLPLFLLGLLLAKHTKGVEDFFRRFPLVRHGTLVAAVALVLHRHWLSLEDLFYVRYISGLGAVLLIPVILTSRSVKRFLQQPALQSLGKVSYSLYLVHEPILFFVATHLYSPLGGSMWTGVLTVLVSLGVATVFYRWFEKPVLTPEKNLKKELVQPQ